MSDYKIEYAEFLQQYESGVTTGENVGELIAKLAQYFSMANSEYAAALRNFNKIARVIEEGSDEQTGKPISSSKAKVIAAATPESDSLTIAKTDLDNIEQMINALKSLQKGILNEYSHTGGM